MEESTALVVTNGRAVAPRIEWDAEYTQIVKSTAGGGKLTDPEFDVFIAACKRTGLDPLTKQIYAVKRWDSAEKREVMTIQVGIDGGRLIAERTRQYAGQLGPYWCGEDGEWVEVWTRKEQPFAAKVAILRNDFQEPLWAVARWSDYYPGDKMGFMWKTKGPLMIGKCAEMLALRRACPQELSGVYLPEEFEQHDAMGGEREIVEHKARIVETVDRFAALAKEYQVDEEIADEFRARYDEDTAAVNALKCAISECQRVGLPRDFLEFVVEQDQSTGSRKEIVLSVQSWHDYRAIDEKLIAANKEKQKQD